MNVLTGLISESAMLVCQPHCPDPSLAVHTSGSANYKSHQSTLSNAPSAVNTYSREGLKTHGLWNFLIIVRIFIFDHESKVMMTQVYPSPVTMVKTQFFGGCFETFRLDILFFLRIPNF